MLSVYINYPAQRISVHQDPGCKWIPVQHKPYQRVIYINSTNVESELHKLRNKEITFAANRGLNDVWFYINLDNVLIEENLVKTIHEILGCFYKRIANAEIKYHCLHKAYMPPQRTQSNIPAAQEFRRSALGKRETIPDRTNKINAIVNTITTRIVDINSQYRYGPSLYFYRRTLMQRRKYPNVIDFLSYNYNLELLYAVLVSWDMNSRGARMKYFDDFKNSIISCRPKLEAIESKLESFELKQENEMLELLKNAYLILNLMETASRLVSNSKCLHFLFPSLCMPMDRTNTLQFLYNNTNDSTNKYLGAIRFQFEIMRQSIQFEKYLDDRWNQNIPKLIDNAIILLKGVSVKHNT